MSGKVDLVGRRFGRLLVLRECEERVQPSGEVRWMCKCNCGAISAVRSSNLRSGNSTSCGCARRTAEDSLTRVQAETLQYLFKGMTYSEIAAVRHRARSTVDRTVEALQELTGTHNARELIYEALSRDWLTPPRLAQSGTAAHVPKT